jgi:DNA-binding FadR family transcriptional regulator
MMSRVFQKILSKFNNPVLLDLYIDLDMFLQVTVFEGFENSFLPLVANMEEKTLWLIDAFENKKADEVREHMVSVYENTYEAMKRYLDELGAAYPQYTDVSGTRFEWNAEKSRVFNYTIIARDLITRIGNGEFPEGSLLPPIAKLAEKYKASPYTIKESLSSLSQLGIVKVINGKGTQSRWAMQKNMC